LLLVQAVECCRISEMNFSRIYTTHSFSLREHPMQMTFFTEQDRPVLSQWFTSQADVTQWAGPDVAWPLEEAFLATLLDSASQKPASLLTFAGRHEGELAAVAQVGFDWNNHLACLCRVAVNPAMRGQNLAESMLRQLIPTVFQQEAIERIELRVYTFNQAAIRTYEKLGFVREGVQRQGVVVGEERWDCALYGMLRQEYQQPAAPCVTAVTHGA